MTILLDEEDVRRLLPMEDCIRTVEEAFRELAAGRAVNAPRRDSFMATSRPDAYYSFKTIEGGLERWGVMAQRVNSDLVSHPTVEGIRRRVKVPAAPGNRYVGLVFLYRAETLEPLAIMTDGHLQRMRVAAVTGIGISYLARKDARTAALLGTGWQAETAAWAMVCTRPVSRIKVYSPNPEHRRRFVEKAAGELGREVVAVESAREAVEGADIVACATNAAEPLVSGEWVGAGTHLSCIRAHEFDEEAWARSDVIVFSGPPASSGYFTYGTKTFEEVHRVLERETEREDLENERFERYRDRIRFLADLVAGRVPGRTEAAQVTLLNKNWGLGIEFAAVAHVVYQRARRPRGQDGWRPRLWCKFGSLPPGS